MQEIIHKYGYKISYIVCLLVAMYILTSKISNASSFTQGSINFAFGSILILLSLYFRYKDKTIQSIDDLER